MMGILPHLEMHQTFGKISIRTQNARQEIRQPQADVLIRQSPAEMHVDRRSAKLRMDQSTAWHNLDLKSAAVRIQEAAEAGTQAVLDGISRHAHEAEELLHIEKNKGRNIIADQAAAHAKMAVIGTHYNTGNTPASEAVHIQVVPDQLRISWQTRPPEISARIRAPEVTYHPGEVRLAMQQDPSLDIRAVGLYIDQKG
jgi:hypothetical protein